MIVQLIDSLIMRRIILLTCFTGIGAFRESHRSMSSAGPVVVVDYRTHLHVIQSNAPKVMKLHPPFIYFSQASAFGNTKAFRYAY